MALTVAVLRSLGVGDLLTGVPALRALRRALPGHRLLLGCRPSLLPLVRLAAVVDHDDDVVPVRTLARLERPAVAVNLHGRGPSSHRLLQRTAPARLVAFAHPGLGVAGPVWHPDEHEVQRWCRLVGATVGGAPDPADLDLALPAPPPAHVGATVVHPGATAPARRWPPERYAHVARELHRRGHEVVVTAGPDEVTLAERVALLAGIPAAAAVAGRTDVGELAALVAYARLVVSGDTGIAHLASAYRRPSVVLFGPVPPRAWGPPPRPQHVALWRRGAQGDPHAARPDPALLALTVADVLGAVEQASAHEERREAIG